MTTSTKSSSTASNTSFGAVRQIDAGLLNVGYVDAGLADGPAVLLLHGWPYDINSYVDVAPLLEAKGYRVIVPFLRGYGTTRFWPRTTTDRPRHTTLGRALPQRPQRSDSAAPPCPKDREHTRGADNVH